MSWNNCFYICSHPNCCSKQDIQIVPSLMLYHIYSDVYLTVKRCLCWINLIFFGGIIFINAAFFFFFLKELPTSGKKKDVIALKIEDQNQS